MSWMIWKIKKIEIEVWRIKGLKPIYDATSINI